jgi:hypothetical protein
MNPELVSAPAQPPADLPHIIPYTPPEPAEEAGDYADEKDVLDLVKEIEKEGLQLRLREEYAWQEAWRFYLGKHWCTWNNKNELQDVDDDDEVPRIVLNFILSMVTTRLGHLIKNRPVLQGLPGTTDEKARQATRMAVQAILAYWRKLKIPKKLSYTLLWMLITGKCLMKVWWDPTAGKIVSKPGPLTPAVFPDDHEMAGQPMIHPDTGEQVMQEGAPITGPTGEMMVAPCFAHETLVEPGAIDIDHAQRLLHTTYMPLGDIGRQWDIDEDELKKLDSATQDDDNSMRSRRMLEGLEQVSGLDLKGRAPVKELWLRPSEKYPQGLYAVVVNGKVRGKPQPLPKWCEDCETGGRDLPFVEFDEIKTNSFYSTSTARQLLDVNRIINIEVSQQEHMRKVLRYKTLVPEQANIDPEAFDERDDEVVTYWAPYAPTHLRPPEVRQSDIEIRNSLIAILKEIGGNWDLLSGRVQGDVRSGRQTAYLQEYAGTVLGVVAQQIEWAITSLGNKMLKILQTCYPEPRLESFVGRDRRVQVLAFRSADLKGCAQIIVQPGSALPISRSEKWDRIEHWMEQKWLDPQIGLRLLDLGDYDTEIYGDEEQDRANADEAVWMLEALQDEQIKAAFPESKALAMKEGNFWSARYLLRVLKIEAFPFDNHPIHMRQIDRALRKTQTYKQWPPERRALADTLVEWHAKLDDPMHGPIEVALDGSNAGLGGGIPPPGSDPTKVPPPGPGGAAPTPGAQHPLAANGSPQSMQGHPTGPGGIGGGTGSRLPESGQERAQGLPGVPRPPGPPAV